MSILIVAGLGNPGRDYAETRHNYGWIVVDALARRHGLTWREQSRFNADVAKWERKGGQSLWLLKPKTFMNESGRSVGNFLRFHKAEAAELAVIYDDLTMDLGLIKLSNQGSSGGHNGVASVLEHVGQGFARFRLGIGPKCPSQMDLKDFVLGKFTSDQSILIQQTLEKTLDGVELLLNEGITNAMNQLNRRNP